MSKGKRIRENRKPKGRSEEERAKLPKRTPRKYATRSKYHPGHNVKGYRGKRGTPAP